MAVGVLLRPCVAVSGVLLVICARLAFRRSLLSVRQWEKRARPKMAPAVPSATATAIISSRLVIACSGPGLRLVWFGLVWFAALPSFAYPVVWCCFAL